MPYYTGVRYMNEAQGSDSSSSELPVSVFIDDYQLETGGEKIITGLVDADTSVITITPFTLPNDGSLFVFARDATSVTVRSTAGSEHEDVWFQFKLEKFN